MIPVSHALSDPFTLFCDPFSDPFTLFSDPFSDPFGDPFTPSSDPYTPFSDPFTPLSRLASFRAEVCRDV
eukprot:12257190-Heterocapsa_arctica.AAC.1